MSLFKGYRATLFRGRLTGYGRTPETEEAPNLRYRNIVKEERKTYLITCIKRKKARL